MIQPVLRGTIILIIQLSDLARRAESPSIYLAQGKRSGTLGQPRAQTLRPERAKVECTTTEMQHNHTNHNTITYIMAWAESVLQSVGNTSVLCAEYASIGGPNMQHGRAESPMRYIAQGKRSGTLGQPRAQTLRPERAKVECTTTEMQHNHTNHNTITYIMAWAESVLQSVGNTSVLCAEYASIGGPNMQHGRAESPMRYIAQGKRSGTLGQPRAQTLRPERAKVECTTTEMQHNHTQTQSRKT